jgi:membrane-associated phospholipid phosphatase
MTGSLPPLGVIVTNLGAASVMLPILALVCAGLWRTGQRVAAGRWLILIAIGATLVMVTKIAFLAFGLGIAELDFAGISGHTTLATAILPVWLGALLGSERGQARFALVGMLCGLALGALVGWSRVHLGAHSPSESVIGWMLGAGISYLTLRALKPRVRAPWFTRGASLILLLALSPSLSSYLPTHRWERELAKAISGREVLHSRARLKQPRRAIPAPRAPATADTLPDSAVGSDADRPTLGAAS